MTINYGNGKIYKITCDENDLVYYGSTCSPLRKRLCGHKSCYKNYTKGGTAGKCKSFDIVKYESCKIELVEDYPCDDKLQLKTRERYFIENNECHNKCTPTKTEKEWWKEHYEKNKEYIKAVNRKYKRENKEKLKIKNKVYNDKNKELIKQKRMIKVKCECGNLITKWNFARHKKSIKHQKYIKTLD